MVEGSFHMMPASDLKLEIADMPEGTEFENLGTTVEVVAKGGALEVGGKTYELQQFHFHLPSEHLDNGTSIASMHRASLHDATKKADDVCSGNAHGLADTGGGNCCYWRLRRP